MTDNLQLYHGSTNKFDNFKIQKVHKNGADMGYGIYLTDNLERATRYAEKYLYTVQIEAKILANSQKISGNQVTLTPAKVTKLVEGIAKQQIKEDGYPYILSDWDEPTSETHIDEGNHQIAKHIAQTTIETAKDDLDIINDLGNQVGGNDSAAATLNPVLNQMNIHYAVRNFRDSQQDQDMISKEYIVFNPKDVKIVSVKNYQVQQKSNNDLKQLSAKALNKSYESLKQQVQQASNPQQKSELKDQLNNVHQEISSRAQNQLKDFAKQNPEVKQPEKEETQQIRR